MAELKPEKDFVLVEEDDTNNRTEAGLFIPQGSQEADIRYGTVLDYGPGRYEHGEYVEVDREEGEKVAWKGFNHVEVRFGGDEYILVPDDSIIATVSEEE